MLNSPCLLSEEDGASNEGLISVEEKKNTLADWVNHGVLIFWVWFLFDEASFTPNRKNMFSGI